MEVLELGEDDVDRGMLVKVREKGQVDYMPLSDVEVTPKTNADFWPVRFTGGRISKLSVTERRLQSAGAWLD